MNYEARAWIEDGRIRCLSQMCELGPCPRIGMCQVVRVTVAPAVEEAQVYGKDCRSGRCEF
jgi:hypothetical protein